MCSASTIIYVRHTRMWTFRCWTSFKFILSQKKVRGIQLIRRVHMYSFSNSFCTRVTDNEHFIDRLLYSTGKDTIHIMREVMLEDVASPRQRLETPTTSMPTGFQLPTRPSPSAVRWNWVQHAGVGLYAWVLGCICRRLAQNGGCGPYTLALGLTRWRWAVHMCVGLYTMAIGSKWRCWPSRWRWV